MDEKERLMSVDRNQQDDEETIRPHTLKDYIGQDGLKDNLKIFIQAAKERNESLDHVLLYGPPGLGKTTLAYILANEMGSRIKIVSGPSIEKSGDLASVLSVLEPGDVLFIDEIHRLPKVIEEVLYPAMEDFVIDVMIGKDTGARSVRLELPPFTLVGATTRAGDLSAPLRDRFGIISKLEYYTNEQLADIIRRSSRVLNVSIDEEAVIEIARRSRGTPRIANRLLKRVRDYVQVEDKDRITVEDAKKALTLMDIDELGLDYVDKRVIMAMIEKFGGGPVGVETISTSIGEEVSTIEDVVEPFLLQEGFIKRTPRGRVALEKAYKHLKISHNQGLFDDDF